MSTFTPQADAPRRRHWLTEPGEPLLAPVAPIGIIERFLDVIRTSGLSPASLCMSRVGAVPVPVPDSPGGGPRAFEGLNPASAWLPLFWLPEHLTRRVMIQEEDDSVRFEDDDEWAVRVLLALDLAGIYDPENGWFDVLASAGLDVNDPEHLARIQAWLDGGDDAEISRINLSDHLPENSYLDWSVAVSGAIVDKTLPVAWAISSTQIVDLIDDSIKERLDPRATCHQVATLARFAFRAMPDDNGMAGIFEMLSVDPEAIVDPETTLASLRADIETFRLRYVEDVDAPVGVEA